MKELKEQKLLSKALDYPKECFDESHNSDNCLTDDTKLVIIGTMTPKGFDYFYCSNRNKIYGYIDEALGTNLKELKKQLNSANNKQDKEILKKEIIKVLKENKIAFIDIMNYVLRYKNKVNSHYDNDIEYYSVDEKVIKQLENRQISIICNSKLCYNTTLKILSNSSITYLPQRGIGSSKENWVNEIRNKIINSTATKILNEHKDAFKELAK